MSEHTHRKPGIVLIGTLVSIVGGIILLFVSCQPPAWWTHMHNAERAYEANDFARMDSEVAEVMKASDGGQYPPDGPRDPLAYVFPMQDLEEVICYSWRLRDIAQNYQNAKRYADAERLFRRALEVDQVRFGKDSEVIIQSSLPPLIELMEEQGKTAEVENLQTERKQVLERLAQKNPAWQASIEADKQEALEKEGKIDEAEKIILERVRKAEKREDMSEAAIEKMKKFNVENKGQVSTSFNFLRDLDLLAEFYRRHKMYEKEEPILKRALELRLRIDTSESTIEDNWSDLAKCLELQGKYKEAADAMTKEIESLEKRRGEICTYPRKQRDELLKKAQAKTK